MVFIFYFLKNPKWSPLEENKEPIQYFEKFIVKGKQVLVCIFFFLVCISYKNCTSVQPKSRWQEVFHFRNIPEYHHLATAKELMDANIRYQWQPMVANIKRTDKYHVPLDITKP